MVGTNGQEKPQNQIIYRLAGQIKKEKIIGIVLFLVTIFVVFGIYKYSIMRFITIIILIL
jgi:hypothetical protein